MNRLSFYDCSGQDGKDNKKAFSRLPSPLRLVIEQTQTKIQQIVEQYNPGRKIYPTSGFRSPVTNSRHAGEVDSLHLFGFARDFRIFPDEPMPFSVPDFMVCVKSKGCWHVAWKRSS